MTEEKCTIADLIDRDRLYITGVDPCGQCGQADDGEGLVINRRSSFGHSQKRIQCGRCGNAGPWQVHAKFAIYCWNDTQGRRAG